jgi:hypothetical protein
MPQSLSLVIVQIIFSTKERFPCLDPSALPHLLEARIEVAAGDARCPTGPKETAEESKE